MSCLLEEQNAKGWRANLLKIEHINHGLGEVDPRTIKSWVKLWESENNPSFDALCDQIEIKRISGGIYDRKKPANSILKLFLSSPWEMAKLEELQKALFNALEFICHYYIRPGKKPSEPG
jgi:hypothetical protein